MCEHNIVLEIYKDSSHKDVSHYICVDCGEKSKDFFGKRIIESPVTTEKIGIHDNIIECEIGPICPACGTVSRYIEDIMWYFNYHTCGGCGINYVARKTQDNKMFESRWRMGKYRTKNMEEQEK